MQVLEVWVGRGCDRVVTLDGSALLIGSGTHESGIVLADDTVSTAHAVLERVGSTWLLRDVGSRNGTRVGGEKLGGQRRLCDGDEILVGRTRLVFRDRSATRRPKTRPLTPAPPDLTKGERRVLVELCRPLLSTKAFQPPASVHEIAGRLCVGKNAVQSHLVGLYRKFDIYEVADRRLVLANEAIERGAVTVADLQDEARS